MANVGLDENLQEVLDGGFVDTSVNNTDGPGVQWLGVREQEFLSSKIPSSRGLWVSRSLVKLNDGVLEDSSIGLANVSIELTSNLAKKTARLTVVIEVAI